MSLMMGTTGKLAAFVVETSSEAISQKARDEVRRALLDVIGTTLAGSTETSGQIITNYARSECGAAGAAAVFAAGFRASASLAALANGTMAHALDYDDVGLQIGHPSVAVIPAALAAAEETGASGRDLLDAIVLGFEIAGRIGAGAGRDAYRKGYHGTSIFGVFGAAAAAGRLLGLDVDQMRRAFGIAGSEAAGVRANFGTMTKPLHAGACGRSGIVAARLAQAGFTSDPNVIETGVGYGDVILGKGSYDLAKMTEGLGTRFVAETGVDIKKFPCCYGNHTTLDGVFALIAEHGLREEDVASISVDVPVTLPEVLIYDRPTTGLQGKFSLQYNIAAAIVDRKVTRATFTDEHAREPRLQAMIEKITVNPGEIGNPRSVRINVTTTGGRVLTREQSEIKGSAEDPLSRDELLEKFRDNAALVLDTADTERVVGIIDSLEEQRSLTPLTDLLVQRAKALAGR
jgi:2-methylcitrate dehydratase PrpD